ncbi:hypothetical protein B0A50_00977 [Salinomyces thailandicus]|uniref:Uncharacterized protein n=1 Tax=Salinomyces thailandicus TaxID=706561 RepID=A0A4U0UDA6_9PEZI|nr:hypothetical protein B0A50_00977 [Salinomyces thailandica]
MQVQTSQQHFDQDHPVPSCQHAKYYQRRDLRPQTAKMRFPSTWIDKDETGNYDPAEKFRRRKRRSYPKPQGRPRPNDLLNTTDEVVDRTAYSLRQSSLILKIQFPSEASKSAFRKHVSHLPPRPHDDFANGYRYERDYKKDPLPTKKPAKDSAGFMPCREAGTLCSFGKDDDQAAYVTRRTMSSVCIPQKMQDGPAAPQQPPAKPHTAAAPSKRAAHDAAKQQTPTKQPKLNEPETVSIGSKKKIISRFCHPIKFNCEDADGTDSCHFCDRSSFSIMGLEAKETEVFDWADGRGYDEVGEGHRETGSAPTRVCAACTMGRVPAIMCQKHEMQPISNVTLETMDIDGAISALFADEHDGDLQRMLAVLEDQPSHERPLGLRADWEFLKEDGLLMRHVLWSTAEVEHCKGTPRYTRVNAHASRTMPEEPHARGVRQ